MTMNAFTALAKVAATVLSAPNQEDDDLWWWDEKEEYEYEEFRFLQEESSNTTDDAIDISSTADGTNDSQVLRQTFLVYGSALLLVVLLFCWARLKFPRAYNLRSGWVEALQRTSSSAAAADHHHDSSPPPAVSMLAQEQHKFFSWIWKLYMITDDELVHECGMDALCLVRIMHMGYRLRYVATRLTACMHACVCVCAFFVSF
jgi:Late exocytosis, associated with Golgi transport